MVRRWTLRRIAVHEAPEGLRRGAKVRVAAARRVDREDRRAGEAEQVVALEGLRDRGVHVAELRAMALVEDDHDVAVVDRVTLVAADERRQLLDRRDDDLGGRVFQLLLEDRRRGVGVGRALLEAVVLAHRLVVEILAVDDEEHLVDVGELRGQLGRLEAGQVLPEPVVCQT